MVETTLSYLADMPEKPVYYFCEPPPGTPWRNTRGKCFNSDPGAAGFTAHSAFDDPTSPADAPGRESIEVRTLTFFAP